MADLTISNLVDKLPAGVATETADDVTISLKTLMGEASVQLATEGVAEFISKLLTAANAAQVDYNAVDTNTDLTSYPAPTFGNPVSDGAGGFLARRNHTVSVAIPLDVDATTAV